ncbi:MAG: hypothetical protein HY751_09195 [Nitrospinae bacterium]|nr:hypothetical protein [Nitrospinota bacterium]
MSQSSPELDMESLDPNEAKLAKVLLDNGKLTQEQVKEYLDFRADLEKGGKKYLGDILVERGYLPRQVVDDFFTEHNQLYLDFCSRLKDEGFLNREQFNQIMAHPHSDTNVVSVMEDLGIMTKENFSKLFANKVNALRLGDWLLAKRKIDPALLTKALAEQKIYRFEDYLVYHDLAPKSLIDYIKSKLGMH